MEDFLTAVKSVRRDAEHPEPALKEVSKTLRQDEAVGAILEEKVDKVEWAETPEQALQVLKTQPSLEIVLQTLTYIQHGFPGSDFNIRMPAPRQAQVINTLVSLTLPDFWSVLGKGDKFLLLDCLRNVAGSNAIIARLRLLSEQGKGKVHQLAELLSAAEDLFKGDEFCFTIWTGLDCVLPNSTGLPSDTKRQMAWNEFVGLIASGKVISTVAQTEDKLKEHKNLVKISWISNGGEYVAWLGRNIAHFLASPNEGKDTLSGTNAAAAKLMSKALTAGYPVPLVRAFMTVLISQAKLSPYAEKAWPIFFKFLPVHARRQLLESVLRWLSPLAGDDEEAYEEMESQPRTHVQAFTALLAFLCNAHETMIQHLMEFLQDPALSSSVSFAIRRASIACLASREPDGLGDLLERLMSTFSDQVFINHAPATQQEGVAQTLLMSAGYIHRKAPIAVLMTVRSSNHIQGVSNRLDSTNQKARWLGMIVGTALSAIVDKQGSKMDFGTEDMLTKQAQWYQRLVALDDHVGTFADIDVLLKSTTGSIKRRKKRTVIQSIREELPIWNGKQTFGPPRPPQSAQTQVIGEKVTELLDDDDGDDVGLKPYAKPDSDPEDSDEDATLVNRNKAKAPVYIRDLMRMLKDDKDHDTFQMALRNAAALIRKKSTFGAEVSDHAEELAMMLCDLQDPFSTDDFDEFRLQALIAVLLSDVNTIAPWLSRQAFAGDYGLGQRCIMLSALGLGGRELAGFKDQGNLNPLLPESITGFPSKRLPERLHDIYTPTNSSVKHLHAASENMQHQLIRPLALSAADKTTSHLNAVKVRTFSSRIEVERTKQKPRANELAKVFSSGFFFPLATRYQQDIAAYGPSSIFTSAPFVLVTFLKTIALLLHASGPATVDLPDITAAFWDLALSLRATAAADMSVLEAVLFSLLTLLEVNGDAKERMAQDNASRLMQTQQWAEIVFEKIGGGEMAVEGSVDETRSRTLAAGVLLKISEIVQERQNVLIGGLR